VPSAHRPSTAKNKKRKWLGAGRWARGRVGSGEAGGVASRPGELERPYGLWPVACRLSMPGCHWLPAGHGAGWAI
jgi:hypothetical protein